MGEWQFLTEARTFLDYVAVVFALTASQGIKVLFFNDPKLGKGVLAPGSLWSRAFPLIPVVLATLWVLLWGIILPEGKGVQEIANRGIISGAVAGYLNRSWKVTVRGQ